MLIGEEEAESASAALTISQGVPTTMPNPRRLLEPIKSITLSEGAQSFIYDERPAAFGPVWKEITIILLCCCGPITQV